MFVLVRTEFGQIQIEKSTSIFLVRYRIRIERSKFVQAVVHRYTEIPIEHRNYTKSRMVRCTVYVNVHCSYTLRSIGTKAKRTFLPLPMGVSLLQLLWHG